MFKTGIIKYTIDFAYGILRTKNVRNIKIKKNIIISFGIKGLSIIVGFLMVRITLDYLDQTRYGIWITLTSFLTWFSFFEIGLGNGLRNKLAEALAERNYELGKIYVSTTYAILMLVISGVAVLFFILNQFVDWTYILNTNPGLSEQLSSLAAIVFGFFFLRFLVKLIGTVLYADQRPALANSFGPIGNLISLILIYILSKTTHSSLLYMAWIFSAVPVVILLLASFFLYRKKYRMIAPSFKYVHFTYSKELLNIGVKFFFLQIIGLVLYQSSNIIITQYFGPDQVTVYNIAFKYFSTINMVFVIIITPFWSAFTEAWTKNDIAWIRKNIRNLLFMWFVFFIIAIGMLISSDFVFRIWIGAAIKVPFILSVFLCIYFVLSALSTIYVYFLNGIGKIYLQIYISVLELLVFVMTTFLLLNYTNMGIEALVIGMTFSLALGTIPMIIQYYKIINNRAKGVWLR